MKAYIYTKEKKTKKKFLKLIAIILIGFGIITMGYISFPILSWQFYFAPAFASSHLAAPVPRASMVSTGTLQSLLSQAAASMQGIDYTNAENWFPKAQALDNKPRVNTYTLTIPKIHIKNAVISTIDYDLNKHLINYPGTPIPPDNGTSVIVGHSTLPQLFNPQDYKTIFANVYKLQLGDTFIVDVEGVSYTYKVYRIAVVDPTDPNIFSQELNNSYITLVTCTPPGTIWKRLLIKAKIEEIS